MKPPTPNDYRRLSYWFDCWCRLALTIVSGLLGPCHMSEVDASSTKTEGIRRLPRTGPAVFMLHWLTTSALAPMPGHSRSPATPSALAAECLGEPHVWTYQARGFAPITSWRKNYTPTAPVPTGSRYNTLWRATSI